MFGYISKNLIFNDFLFGRNLQNEENIRFTPQFPTQQNYTT